MASPRRILVATDLTPASMPAFEEAVRLAREDGAELILAHAYELPNMGAPMALAPEAYEDIERRLRGYAESRIQELSDSAHGRGVRARTLVVFGDPSEAIAKVAADEAVDLVIMGTHGRRGFSRLFLGSVATRVISTSPCPVLTVRAA